MKKLTAVAWGLILLQILFWIFFIGCEGPSAEFEYGMPIEMLIEKGRTEHPTF